MDLSHNGP